METVISIEKRLRNWIPRRPSATLKTRLFAPRPHPAEPVRSAWLQPARLGTVSTWLVVLFLSGYAALRDPGLNGPAYRPMMAVTLSNQTLGTHLLGNYHATHAIHNAPPARRIEWTSLPASPSSVFSLSQLGTNHAR